MKIVSISTALALIGLTASTAVAQDLAADANVAAPSFATLDRVDSQSHVDMSLATSFFDGEDPDFNTRLDFHGQYVNPAGMGGYAALPISYLSDNDMSETALGNLELGGIYTLDQGATDIILRGGVALPTAADDFEGAITNFATMTGRFTDLVAVAADSTWLRLAASPIHRSGNLVVRGDLGFDIAVDEPDGSDIDPLIRANIGVGYVQGNLALMGEFVTVGTTGDVGDDADRFLHTAAFTVRGKTGSVSPFGSLVIPVNQDDSFIDVSFVAMGGVQIPIGQ